MIKMTHLIINIILFENEIDVRMATFNVLVHKYNLIKAAPNINRTQLNTFSFFKFIYTNLAL